MRTRRTHALPVRPAAVLEVVLSEYERHLVAVGRASTATRHRYYLKKIISFFQWTMTPDIPVDVFARMERQWAPYTARMGQWAVLGFVRWGRERYYFHEELLSRPMTCPPALHGAIWGDDVRETILTRLRGEDDQPERSAAARSRRKTLQQARKVRHDAARRSVLYPLVHLVLTWAVRRAEVISLRVKDWEPTTRTLTIRRSTTRRHITRSFVVDNETAAVLNHVAAHRDSEDCLFRTRRGSKWCCLHLSRQVRFLMKQIGMRGSLVECHAAAVRRLLRQHPRDPETVLAITGISAMRYLRTYLERTQEHANSRRRSQKLYEDLMVAFHETQGDFGSGTPAEFSEGEPVETMDLKGLVGGVVHSREWRP